MGGGYTGAAAAVQLDNAADVAITIVDPQAEPGRGVAYATRDPDHRLNGPLDNHLLDPSRPEHLRDWCMRNGVLDRDPGALAANGGIYLRRADFGDYIAATLAERAGRIRHERAVATGLRASGARLEVLTDDGRAIASDAVIVATGNGESNLPQVLREVAPHAALIENPFDAARMQAIPPDARVLLVGSGLTALDAISTLLRRGHRAGLEVLSRHGIRPRGHRARLENASVTSLLARIEGEVPEYARRALERGNVLALCRELQRRIDEVTARGGDWHVPFDELRNAVWRFWPALDPREKRRFLRHLRGFYDAHRFRAPPQNEALARAAERDGRLAFRAGRLRSVRALDDRTLQVAWREPASQDRTRDFDAVINCTGLDPAMGATRNPFLLDLQSQGMVQRDATGMGIAVDAQCRPIGRNGNASPRLRVLGPPTAGALGDPLGVIFIAPQIRRMMPGLLETIR